MRVLKSIAYGFRRMAECSGLVLAVWLLVLLAALPLAAFMEEMLRTDIGDSLMHQSLRHGLDLGWLEEFQFRQDGLADTLKPVRVSPAFFFETLELWTTGEWLSGNRALAAAAVTFLLLWILLQGGVLTHLGSPDLRFRLSTFLTAGGAYFFRFLRLALMMGLGYYGVYRLAFWLFPAIDRWTIDVTVERTVLAFHLSALALVGLLMVVVHLIAQYAKIATVRERRRSMLLAVLRSVRLVLAHPLQSVGLYGTMLATLGILQVTYFWLAPETTGASPLSLVFAFALGQVYLIFRWAIRIARYGAEIEQFDRWTGHPTGRGATDVG